MPLLGKFGLKNQNTHFMLKFGTYTNSNTQNSVMLFTFFCFWVEMPFLGKFGPKNQNSHFKLKLGTYTSSNMQNSMVMFILSVFDWECPFWANLVQKVKIISWSWNVVARLIRICRTQWCCSLFLFWVEIPFLGKFGPKSQNYQLKLKFVT